MGSKCFSDSEDDSDTQTIGTNLNISEEELIYIKILKAPKLML